VECSGKKGEKKRRDISEEKRSQLEDKLERIGKWGKKYSSENMGIRKKGVNAAQLSVRGKDSKREKVLYGLGKKKGHTFALCQGFRRGRERISVWGGGLGWGKKRVSFGGGSLRIGHQKGGNRSGSQKKMIRERDQRH